MLAKPVNRRFGITYLDTLALWQTDPWLLLTDDEDVAFSGSEGVVNGVLDVDNVEASVMSLTMSDDTNSTHVTTTSHHGDDTSVELDELCNLSGCKINLDSVVDLDDWVGIPDSIHLSAFVKFSSNQTLVQRLIDTSATYVRASCVTKNGMPPRPSCTLLTFPSLYSASVASTR